jgi:hypothetical protein
VGDGFFGVLRGGLVTPWIEGMENVVEEKKDK